MKVHKICSVEFQQSFYSVMSLPFDGLTSYRLAKAVKKLKEEFETFNPIRLEICKKYAMKDDKGETRIIQGRFAIPPEKLDELTKEVEAAGSAEVDLGSIPLSAFKNLQVAPLDLVILDGFIVDDLAADNH